MRNDIPDGVAGVDTVTVAFTTRIPLAVMILLGIKRWENRAAWPWPTSGVCGMSCSKGSDAREYAAFRAWAQRALPPAVCAALPAWEQVADWRGKLIATCDYAAGTAPGDRIWDEGYPVWWKLANVRLLETPLAVRGSVGMWRLPQPLRVTARAAGPASEVSPS